MPSLWGTSGPLNLLKEYGNVQTSGTGGACALLMTARSYQTTTGAVVMWERCLLHLAWTCCALKAYYGVCAGIAGNFKNI